MRCATHPPWAAAWRPLVRGANKFVAPPRPEQSQQTSKRPVYGDRKRLAAKAAKKAAKKAARQDASCYMASPDPAPLDPSTADDMTSGAHPQPAHEAVAAPGTPISDTATTKPAPWQPVMTSPITADELSSLPARPMSPTEATVRRLFPSTALQMPTLAPAGCADKGPLPQPSTDPPPAATAEQSHLLQPPPPPAAGAPKSPLWQRLLKSSLVGLLHVVLAVPAFMYAIATA